MYQTECKKTYENSEKAIDSIVSKDNLWYSSAEKNTTNSTLTIESNPCFRILQPNSNQERRGNCDARLQKTVINIVHQKRDNELMHPIFNCIYEILNHQDAPAISSE